MDATPEDTAYVTPEEAARSLREIRASQARVVRARPWFPNWYTTGVALVVTGVQFFTEPGTSGAVAVAGLTTLVLVLLGLVAAMVFGNRQRPHRSLVTVKALFVFLVWVWTSVGVCLVAAVALAGAGVPYARTYAGLAMTVLMASTGPVLGRWITRRMAAKIEAG
ncbi:hypothetical protein [Sphaerisporangium corydalis]|uniref:Transmembrane protein n=1 Tax=Sphaerisporangium corydalis TaxID=1441875 RepID=A0ABV9ED48_9ACTN|nr:hypothetical protein [Sphaerisporangium corydalis]